ncbi:glycosyltransferase family protein [Labilibacter marinus]|uniref:glycosyltransferase n=1 Tax=Labilibacter marinus TaxID=1477105 RepID=UPI00082E3837|nr:glycosyltransferase [Labilibacter marinus]
MKVLLLGEYSSLHYNLAIGLKKLGMDVTLASTGDGWKNVPRDIDLKQPKKLKHLLFALKIIKTLPKLIGYDIVQLIAPNYLVTSPLFCRIHFNILKRFNPNIFMCATGMDYFYVNKALKQELKYSIFYISDAASNMHVKSLKSFATAPSIKKLNIITSNHCKGIIATSTGYHKAYIDHYPDKTIYIPLPIDTNKYKFTSSINPETKKIKFLLGLMKDRVKLKGTDRIKKVLELLKEKYPNEVELTIVDSVPFEEYVHLVNNSHILCDQLYAYGIGMNGLIAQSKGLIVGGGADEEMYNSLGEDNNKPILDLNTSNEEMLKTFEKIIENKRKLVQQAHKSREFVVKHHDCEKVAQQYLTFWKSKIS